MNRTRIVGWTAAGALLLGAVGWGAWEPADGAPVAAPCTLDLSREEWVPASLGRLAYGTVERELTFAAGAAGPPAAGGEVGADTGTRAQAPVQAGGGVRRVRIRVERVFRGEVPTEVVLGQRVLGDGRGGVRAEDPLYHTLEPGKSYVFGYRPDPSYGTGWALFAKPIGAASVERWVRHTARSAKPPVGPPCVQPS
ncbi:hypothetical protein ACN20G_25110 [Streptomyces sp. BI20]|uniref:hypothetical protein n=1 Tax=Streptomyces sp. BI20 TaxID=3403460 RepID=UPI003C77A8CC